MNTWGTPAVALEDMETPVTANVRKLLTALLAVSVALVVPIAAAGPASADRCQPEELVLGPGNAPLPEDATPVCAVMNDVVYPTVGCNATPTLIACVNKLTPNPVPDVSNPIPPQGPLPTPPSVSNPACAVATFLGFENVGDCNLT